MNPAPTRHRLCGRPGLYTASVIYLWIAILAAQAAAAPSYNWTLHTISQLAAPGNSNRWVMQLGLVGFGAILSIAAARNVARHRGSVWIDGPLVVAGVLLLLTGIVATRPFLPGVPYSEWEATVHGAAATVCRTAVCFSMLAGAVMAEPGWRKVVHWVCCSLAIVLAVLLAALTDGLGLAQRLLFVVGPVWLVFHESELGAVIAPADLRQEGAPIA